MFFVPRAIFRSRTAGYAERSAFTPTSQTITRQPRRAAIEEAPVTPRVRLTVCAAVTDCGAEDTPSSTTPLSAAKTILIT